MCLAIPMKLLQRRELEGTAELRGVMRTVSLLLCPEAQVGDFVLVHAGCALGTVDAVAAAETLALIDEVMLKEEVPS